jgi:tRNA (cmo5U34)-methyltransferase
MHEARTAADFFGGMVESYDSLIRRAVPRYDEMTERLLAYSPPTAAQILELGCGTGNLTLRLATGHPGARITAVDAAPEMTALTGARAARRGVPIDTVTARFEEVRFDAGAFDLVASCMSLHHVRDKAALYRSIARWLRPGGTLALADQLRGRTDAIQREHWDLWLRFCREPGHCSEEEIKSLEDHAAAHDHYASLEQHGSALKAAGFAGVDCVWRNGMYTVLIAER